MVTVTDIVMAQEKATTTTKNFQLWRNLHFSSPLDAQQCAFEIASAQLTPHLKFLRLQLLFTMSFAILGVSERVHYSAIPDLLRDLRTF